MAGMTVDTKQTILNALEALDDVLRDEGRLRVRFHQGDYANLVQALRNIKTGEFLEVQTSLWDARRDAETATANLIKMKIRELKLKLDRSIIVTVVGYTPFNDGDECDHHFNVELDPDDRPSYRDFQNGKYSEFGITFSQYEAKFKAGHSEAIVDAISDSQHAIKANLGTNWQIKFSILQDGTVGTVVIDHYDSNY